MHAGCIIQPFATGEIWQTVHPAETVTAPAAVLQLVGVGVLGTEPGVSAAVGSKASRMVNPMAVHYTTFVLPRGTFGLDYDVPVLVLAADDGRLPADLPTSLHRRGREVMPFSHATMMDHLGPLRVSDIWIAAVAQYDDRAKVVVVLESVPRDITTEYADPGQGARGVDLPPWIEDLLQLRLPSATRDVPVSAGESFMNIMIDPGAPTRLPAWADQVTEPKPGG